MDRELSDNACNFAQTVVIPVNDNSILQIHKIMLYCVMTDDFIVEKLILSTLS